MTRTDSVLYAIVLTATALAVALLIDYLGFEMGTGPVVFVAVFAGTAVGGVTVQVLRRHRRPRRK